MNNLQLAAILKQHVVPAYGDGTMKGLYMCLMVSHAQHLGQLTADEETAVTNAIEARIDPCFTLHEHLMNTDSEYYKASTEVDSLRRSEGFVSEDAALTQHRKQWLQQWIAELESECVISGE